MGVDEHEADMVMFIYRPEYYGITEDEMGPTAGVAEVIVAKNRRGKVGNVRLRFLPMFLRFENLSWEPPVKPVNVHQIGDGEWPDAVDLDVPF